MAKTPEGKIVELTQAFLHERFIFNASKALMFPDCAKGWYYVHTQGKFGAAGIPDIVGQFEGRFFALELKRPGRRTKPLRGCTPWQHAQTNAINQVGGVALVVDGEEDLDLFWRRICPMANL